MMRPSLLQIRRYQIDHVFGQLVWRRRASLRRKEMVSNVMFQDFCHNTVDAASHICQQHQDIRAIIASGQGTFDGINLP
jgi:hypothetical protein